MTYVSTRILNALQRFKSPSSIGAEKKPVLTASPTGAPPNTPSLLQRHVEDARLFATRFDMIKALRPGAAGFVVELGVALCDFSDFLIKELRPTKFYAADIYTMHENPIIWGQPSSVLFEGLNQFDYCKKKLAEYGDLVSFEVGPSEQVMERFADGSLDMIYVDAGHDYDNVRRDAEVCARKLKTSGVLIFNDYIMADLHGHPYGVVPAVNEMIVAGGWKVIGFAFDRNMFCDIALIRA